MRKSDILTSKPLLLMINHEKRGKLGVVWVNSRVVAELNAITHTNYMMGS